MIGAGHKGDELVAVGGGHAGVVERLVAEVRDGIVEIRLVHRVDELVEFEAVLVGVIDPVVEGGQHLIFALLVEGVELNRGVRLPVGFVLILHQGAEHAAVQHIVAVNQQVVAGCRAVGVDEGNAAEAVFPGKIRVEIFFRVGGGVHHRVVDGGAVDAQPAEQIVVLLIKGGVFRQHHRLRGFRLRGGGGFLGGLGGLGFRRRGLRGDGRGVFLHHLGELAEIAAGLAHVNQDGGHRDQRDAEDGHQ